MTLWMTRSAAPPKVPGDPAQRSAEDKTDRHSREPDGKRDPRAIQRARQEIATEAVRPKKEHLPPGDAKEMEIGLEKPPEPVSFAVDKEPQGLADATIVGVDAGEGLPIDRPRHRVHKGRVDPALVEDANPLGPRFDETHVPLVRVVRCDELAKESREIQQQEDQQPRQRQPVPREPPPDQLPLRGEVVLFVRGRQSDSAIGPRSQRLLHPDARVDKHESDVGDKEPHHGHDA